MLSPKINFVVRLSLVSVPPKSVFSPESLDSKDRQILEVICRYGRVGQSFNKLVNEVKPFISRSTFALRVERLQRLGYIEKLPDNERKQVKRIKGTIQARMLMWLVARAKDEISRIEKFVSEKEDEFSKQPKELSPEEINAFKDFMHNMLERITQIFSWTTMVAIIYGENAAGDIFLPSTVESFRKVMPKFASAIKMNPELARAAFTVKEPSEEKIKETKMFFEEFGEEILERLPKQLESRKTILEEVMKNPERIGLLLSALWI